MDSGITPIRRIVRILLPAWSTLRLLSLSLSLSLSLFLSLLARFTENRRFRAGELNHFARLSRRWEYFFEFEKRNNVWNGGEIPVSPWRIGRRALKRSTDVPSNALQNPHRLNQVMNARIQDPSAKVYPFSVSVQRTRSHTHESVLNTRVKADPV